MAQIKEYANAEAVTPQPFESTAFSLERFSRADQDSIQKGSNALQEAGKTYQQHSDRVTLADAVGQSAKENEQLESDYAQLRQNSTYDPANPTAAQDAFMQKVQASHDKIRALATSGNTQDAIDTLLAKDRDRWHKTIINDQISDETQRVVAQTNSFIDTNANLAAQRPEQAEDLAKQTEFYLGAMLPSEHHEGAITQANAKIADSAIGGITSSLMKNQDVTETQVNAALSHMADNSFLQKATPGTYEKSVAALTELRDQIPARQERAARLAEADAARQQKKLSEDTSLNVLETLGGQKEYTYEQARALVYQNADKLGPEGVERMLTAAENDIERRRRPMVEARTDARAAAAEARQKASFEGEKFHDAYTGITTGEITDVNDIYPLGNGPDGLPIQQVTKLVNIFNERQKSLAAGDGYAGQSKNFHDGARAKIVEPFGFSTPEGKAAFYDANQEVLKAEADGRKNGLTPQQMFDPKSDKYIGGPYDRAIEAAKTQYAKPTAPATAAPPKIAPFSEQELAPIPRGATGTEKGMAALQAAVKAGKLRPSAAEQLATQHGWWKPPPPK